MTFHKQKLAPKFQNLMVEDRHKTFKNTLQKDIYIFNETVYSYQLHHAFQTNYTPITLV